MTTFVHDGVIVQAMHWQNVVRKDVAVSDDAILYDIWVFLTHAIQNRSLSRPMLRQRRQTIFQLYLDRWSVEQLPLATKQMIGLQRHFVFNTACCWRLPELGLLAGNMLTHVAKLVPPMPTGYWDRMPKRTPGRLRRVLAQSKILEIYAFDPRIRPKVSKTDHLPKGIEAHRRKKATKTV